MIDLHTIAVSFAALAFAGGWIGWACFFLSGAHDADQAVKRAMREGE